MPFDSAYPMKNPQTVSTGQTGLNAKMAGNMVFLYTDNNTIALPTVSSAGWQTICTLPSALRPSNMFKSLCSDNSTEAVMTCRIKADGSFDIYALPANSGHYINMSCFYFV